VLCVFAVKQFIPRKERKEKNTQNPQRNAESLTYLSTFYHLDIWTFTHLDIGTLVHL